MSSEYPPRRLERESVDKVEPKEFIQDAEIEYVEEPIDAPNNWGRVHGEHSTDARQIVIRLIDF